MGASFPEPYELTKAEYNGGFPKELDIFSYDHHAVPDGGSCIVGYSLSGDIPAGLSVNGAGIIEGKIKHFGQQPSCPENKPHKEAVLDGATWNENGRYDITVDWTEEAAGSPCSVPGSTTKSCLITLKKNFSIDNNIFVDDYLQEFEFGDYADPKPLQTIYRINMPPISRLDDIGLGHDCHPPTKVIEASGNVNACSKAVHRVGDNLQPHACGGPPHPRHASSGSTTVFTNSRGTVRIGDSIDCGGILATGCGTVIVGG